MKDALASPERVTPCISADVGGVLNLMKHNEEGYVYPLDETYMLAYYIKDLFGHPDRAAEFGRKARIHAKKTHDAETNFKTMLDMYESVIRLECK